MQETFFFALKKPVDTRVRGLNVQCAWQIEKKILKYFEKAWDYTGPWKWNISASSANANNHFKEKPMCFFSIYFD